MIEGYYVKKIKHKKIRFNINFFLSPSYSTLSSPQNFSQAILSSQSSPQKKKIKLKHDFSVSA